MTKQSIYLSAALVGLGAVFAILSVLVWLSRGHPALIRHKLRIGALLISVSAMLTAGVTGCIAVSGDDPPEVDASCYVLPPPPNRVLVDGVEYGKLTVAVDVSPEVTGVIWNIEGTRFSFRVDDHLDNPLQVGDLQATDGAFDDDYEAFVLVLSRNLPAGEHRLSLYAGSFDQEPFDSVSIASFRLIILRRSSH